MDDEEGSSGVNFDFQIDQDAAIGRHAARRTHRCAPAVV